MSSEFGLDYEYMERGGGETKRGKEREKEREG